MKCKFKYIALALASVLLCFLMTGCEGDPNAWKFDMEGNEINQTTRSGRTITRTYVVNSSSVSANGRALAAQEVVMDSDADMPIQVSLLYVVSKDAMENALSFTNVKTVDQNGEQLDLSADTNTERYVILTFHYGSTNAYDMDWAQIVYRNNDKTVATIKYDSSLSVLEGDPDTGIINGSLKAILSYSNELSSAMHTLSQQAYTYGDNLIVDALLAPEIAD